MRGFLLILAGVACLYYWDLPKASSATPKAAHSRKTPTAEEYRLESECGELREKVDRQYRRENPLLYYVTVTSHYSSISNRCLVRAHGTPDSWAYAQDDLYDAQTMEVLAGATVYYLGDGGKRYSAFAPQAIGDDYASWNKAKDFIKHAMQGDENP